MSNETTTTTATRECGPFPGSFAGHALAHREDLAITALIEQIAAIDGCTRDDALRQILAFEQAFSEL